MTLEIGQVAPDFSLPNENNEIIELKKLRGKKIILYFYPKDNTPGCTREACNFRDSFTQISDQNTLIYGISKDKPETHRKFKEKYKLPFSLLSDINGDICEAYDVLNKKSLFGNTFLGITRSTFLIDEQGIIRSIWRKVKVNEHTKQVQHELNQI